MPHKVTIFLRNLQRKGRKIAKSRPFNTPKCIFKHIIFVSLVGKV